jgi:hypothetical protein
MVFFHTPAADTQEEIAPRGVYVYCVVLIKEPTNSRRTLFHLPWGI